MALKGDISEIPIKQIFLLVESTKGTGKLYLENRYHKVIVSFNKGNLVNAEGDKDSVSSLKLAFGLNEGSFEFDRTEDISEADNIDELKNLYKNVDKIIEEWNLIRKTFPSEHIIVSLSDAKKEEIEISGKEWKIISILKEPLSISSLLKSSPYGVFETLEVLLSLFDKGLLEIKGTEKSENDKIDESIGNIVPVRNLGYWAMKTPIEGIKAIEFYRRVDDKKTLKDIAKEMGIPLKEAKEIFDYLVKADKLDKPK